MSNGVLMVHDVCCRNVQHNILASVNFLYIFLFFKHRANGKKSLIKYEEL